MQKLMTASKSAHLMIAALFAIVAAVAPSNSTATTLEQPRNSGVMLAQNSPQAKAEKSVTPVPTGSPSDALSWTFGAQPASGAGWTIERGTMTLGQGAALLQPDSRRRVVLLSPSGLPDALRSAEEFVIGVQGTGLKRVRVQARRDPRGGWITIADASGAAMRPVADGVAITRSTGTRDRPVERLRIELTFRTTNPRPLTRISVNPAPR